ncbi:ABC transporter family protein [Histomonas meleagridis]|uniref:ABC transporter family protein n=1 Tax=Histomonas meleagridis TaxID=135588 RepID=UPI0035598BDD|nr:ABC transporter family protein [Histomonas meleagridis]KAH0799596.1 ABC transporter family protein [Histomonas meleagridis]
MNRLTSELASNKSAQADDNLSSEEKAHARNKLYGMLFSDWLAWVALIPALGIGVLPSIFIWLGTPAIDAITDWQYSIFRNQFFPEYYTEVYDPMPLIETQIKKMAIVVAVMAVLQFFITMLWTQIGSRVTVRIKTQMFSNMMRSDVKFFDVRPVGDILTLLSEDAESVQLSFGKVKGVQAASLSQGVTGVVFAFVSGWDIALIMLICVPLIAIVLGIIVPSILRNSDDKFHYTSQSMTIAEETLASVRTVRGFNREEYEIGRFAEATKNASKHERNISLILSVFLLFVLCIVVANVLCDFYYGAVKVDNNDLTLGELLSIFVYTVLGALSIVSLQGTMQGEQKAIASGTRIMRVMEYESAINFDGGTKIKNFKGKIEFRNVSFKYPTRDAYVLKNVSFIIEPDQTGALVGHSGSGKSTCVQLLERFYDVTEGQILLDGHDIRTLDPHWLHKKIALVSQEPILFRTTIANNLRYGAKKASQKELDAAVEVANATKILTKLENGYDTIAGDKGTSLSGGQRQRIAIARAVLMKPRILICDEATSALDAKSEKKVQLALDKVMEGCTAVIVAHRLSTIKNADVIYVFDSGEILESGKHEELLQRKGPYYNLVKRQLSKDMAKENNEKTNKKNEKNTKDKKNDTKDAKKNDTKDVKRNTKDAKKNDTKDAKKNDKNTKKSEAMKKKQKKVSSSSSSESSSLELETESS